LILFKIFSQVVSNISGVIKKSGNSYFFEETKLGGSFQSAREFLKQNPEISKKIFEKIKSI
jgi:hypothetical protein